MVCECAAHRASGVPVGQLGESTGEASAAAHGLASWGRPWSGEGFTSLRRPSGALAAALAGLHPSVPGKVRRRRVFGAAPCTAGKLGARPHALTSPWGRNRGTKRPLGAELRCLGVQGRWEPVPHSPVCRSGIVFPLRWCAGVSQLDSWASTGSLTLGRLSESMCFGGKTGENCYFTILTMSLTAYLTGH